MKVFKLGKPLIHLHSIDSTNKYATQILNTDNAEEGTVILADFQTRGKGQGNNNWVSESGKNLLLSIILRPNFLPAEKQYFLSMSVANGLIEFLSFHNIQGMIKWPNDILTANRKIAGILIENSIMGKTIRTSVIGIGMNINQQNFSHEAINAISMAQILQKEFLIPDLIPSFLQCLNRELDSLYNLALPLIRTKYLNRLYRLNEWSLYKDASGPFEGRIVDVAESGELIVKNRKGEMKNYGFKEIEILDR